MTIITALFLIIIWELTVLLKICLYRKSGYYKLTKNSYFSVYYDRGKFGEYAISKRLKNLKGTKRFLFNIYIPKEDNKEETTEIDVILLHNSGIYVMESKNYSGWIFGSETKTNWTQSLAYKGRSKKNKFLNPIIQNKVNLKHLAHFLKSHDINNALYSYIVFSERCTLKKIKLTTKDHIVINRYNILKAVNNQIKVSKENLSEEEITNIYNILYPCTQVSKELKLTHIENINKKKKTITTFV